MATLRVRVHCTGLKEGPAEAGTPNNGEGPLEPGHQTARCNHYVTPTRLRGIVLLAVFCLGLVLTGSEAYAQRQMEHLGRGVVAVRRSTSQAYVSWRLLATDPPKIGFNLYRSANGSPAVKINPLPLTNTTDYVDGTLSFAVSNAYYVRPVVQGLEQPASAAATLPANSPVRQYIPMPLQPVSGGLNPPYDVKFCWVGDLDGDGEYDYVVDRLSKTAESNQYLQAYQRDGTLLWQMDMGFNSTNQYSHEPGSSAISIGMGDCVTVYDMDGDNRAEVLVRTANGVTVRNASGAQVATITAANNVTQFMSVFDGLSGVERARATLPNPYSADGPLFGHMGIMYCDGVRPSVVYQGWNRIGGGHFNMRIITWDFRGGQLTQRWVWDRGYDPYEDGHQIRIADVDHDGKDEFCEIGFVIDDNGQPLFGTELKHGDRYHITDMDPDRPGLETFAIQQTNPSLLATALYDSGSGKMLKMWYSGSVVDVGRGVALDCDPRYRGVEMYSTQPGVFDCKGNQISPSTYSGVPSEGLWWDADLLRETIDGPDGGKLSPVINKPNYTANNYSRLYSIYNEGVHQAYGGRAAFWGDISGDWREELVLVANDYSEIRLYLTTVPATNRLYCLMQNPAYRCQATAKGYYQASYPDFFLGMDMPVPAPPPLSDAKLVWRGGGANLWDTGVTANWRTNGVWTNSTPATLFNAADTVLFDLTGSNHTAVSLVGTLTPGAVRVHSPKDYSFGGAGKLSGGMDLVKAGGGSLTLTGTNDYTGSTVVAEGALIVLGSLPASLVTVRGGVWLDGRICGTGVVGSGVTIEQGGGASPGLGTNSPGTLTVNSDLALQGYTWSEFDLSSDPSGTIKTNDRLAVLGNLALRGTNRIYVHTLEGALPAGTYVLITYGGSLSGGLTNLIIDGLEGVPFALANPPGQIALQIKSTRAPATLTWAGGLGANAWDLLSTSNWLNGASRDVFVPQDSVRFDNTGAANSAVSLSGSLAVAQIVVDSTAHYTLGGSGLILGPASVTKSNTGTLTINALNNEFTGRTLISGGMVVVPELDAVGFPSPLGNPGASPTNLFLGQNSTLRVTGESYTDRGLTLGSGTNSLDLPDAAVQLTFAGHMTGSGALQKTGAGTLALTGSNSFSGVTIIKAGVVSLGGDTANQYAFGSGSVILDGGTLTMFDNNESYNSASWNVAVPSGASGTWIADSRVDLYGTLLGSGTLNFFAPYVRTTLHGNWSAFNGQINVTTDSDGGEFRINNSFGYAGAMVNLGNNVRAYHMSSGAGVAIGSLSGSSSSQLSGAAWTVGARNMDATFSGTILGNSITKVGTGTWMLTGTNSYAGTTAVNAGRLVIQGDHSGAVGNVTVAAAATLAGTGVIGSTVTVSGTVAPGHPGIGRLRVLGAVQLNPGSTTLIEISKAPVTNDVLAVVGSLSLGGRLLVTNTAGGLGLGDVFRLFEAGALSGGFNAFSLPPLPSALAWDTSKVGVDGTIRVTTNNIRPVITGINIDNGRVVLTGGGGVPNAACYLVGSDDLSVPVADWARVATGVFTPSGNFAIDQSITGAERAFYAIQVGP